MGYLTELETGLREAESSLLDEACSAVQQFHPNLLLVGSEAQTESMLNSLRPALRQPLLEATCGKGLSLPAHEGTIVVREIAALDLVQQTALLQWLTDQVGRSQLVSVSSTSLFPLVERNVFLESLYYRLNTVILKME